MTNFIDVNTIIDSINSNGGIPNVTNLTPLRYYSHVTEESRLNIFYGSNGKESGIGDMRRTFESRVTIKEWHDFLSEHFNARYFGMLATYNVNDRINNGKKKCDRENVNVTPLFFASFVCSFYKGVIVNVGLKRDHQPVGYIHNVIYKNGNTVGKSPI